MKRLTWDQWWLGYRGTDGKMVRGQCEKMMKEVFPLSVKRMRDLEKEKMRVASISDGRKKRAANEPNEDQRKLA